MIYKFQRWFVIQIFYPFLMLLAKFFSSKKFEFMKIIININNKLVLKYPRKINPNILILLPHCLQFDECVFRITKNLTSCKRCGKCVIKDFAELEDKTHLPIKIATGGTIARRYVKEIMPDIIIACACERDLSSGIYDSYPFLVYGVYNERPNGDCVNTVVDINKIEDAIKLITVSLHKT